MDEFIGIVKIFAGNFAPKNWAFCNGQLLSIAQNTALFSILGTTYGGDGRVTFGLPNLQSRIPIGAGQGPGLSNYELGQVGGAETVTLTVNNLPSHNHLVGASSDDAGPTVPTNNDLAVPASPIYATGNPSTTMSPNMIKPNGGNQPAATIPPYLSMYYIICMFGIFPSRN